VLPGKTGGRPRLFHSDACRISYWNAAQRGPASPVHKITEFDEETRQGVCEICGPVTVYASRDKYADGRRRRRLSCSNRVKSHAYVTNQRYHRSLKRHAKRHGLTVEELIALIVGQLGRCAICDCELVAMQVDHAHDEEKRVRGLLCVTCNTGLGKLGDTTERLEAALAYLRAAG
jgi:hypothetical protein